MATIFDDLPFDDGDFQEIPETKDVQPPAAFLLGDLQRSSDADGQELIKNRLLCRGGGALLVGPTGIGKSSLGMQLSICWAQGKACFGLAPARPLKIILIQAENDDGDMADMRDGVSRGLEINEADRATAFGNILVCRCDDITGMLFFTKVLAPLLEEHKPDLVIIDPLFAYLGGDASKQEVVSKWLRNGLNPLLRSHNCGCVLVHHTNKPPTGKEKGDWKAGDYAYLGSGSAELANWARAVIAMRSIGSHDIYELRLGKRGSRAGWKNPDGTTRYTTAIAHSQEPGQICWNECDPDAVEAELNGKRNRDIDNLVGLLKKPLTGGKWQTQAEEKLGISKTSFYRLKGLAIEGKMVAEIDGKWRKTA